MGSRKDNQRTVARTRKMRARNYRFIRAFLVVIGLCAAFVLGFLVRGHAGFLGSLGFSSFILGGAQGSATEQAVTADVETSLSARVAEMEKILAEDSLDAFALDDTTGDVLAAFATATDDPYMRYYAPDRYQSLLNNQDEGYAGIGVLFSEYNGQAYVVDVFEGGPAQLAGVREGDFVVSINGDNSQTWSRSEVAAVLSQAQGTDVVIGWRRPETLEAEGGTALNTTLRCAEYNEVNVTQEYDADRRVGYVKVRQLTQSAGALVQSALTDLQQQGAGAFVLDLRDNPGGYLTQAVSLVSLFLSSGTVVEVQTLDGVSAKSASGRAVTDAPLVVLVNKNTAAAAEVVAAAFKDHQRATIVGTNTLGKGSVQTMSELSFGGALRYTAAYYLTPQGHAIDQVGVTPTVSLEMTAEGDAQRDYAMEVAASQVPEE